MSSECQTAIVAEEHWLCRMGLSYVFRCNLNFSEVISCENFNEVLDAIPRCTLRSPLLIIANDLPGLNEGGGLEFLKQLLPPLRIGVLSETCDRLTVKKVFSAGANGMIPKSSGSDYFERALRLLAEGGDFVPDCPGGGNITRLTARQKDVLRLLSAGNSNKEIARTLRISEGTVKVHVHASFRTLGVNNRVSAASALRALEKTSEDSFRMNINVIHGHSNPPNHSW